MSKDTRRTRGDSTENPTYVNNNNYGTVAAAGVYQTLSYDADDEKSCVSLLPVQVPQRRRNAVKRIKPIYYGTKNIKSRSQCSANQSTDDNAISK